MWELAFTVILQGARAFALQEHLSNLGYDPSIPTSLGCASPAAGMGAKGHTW